VSSHARWAPAKLDPGSWRAPAGRTRAEAIAEQDEAAGGHLRRKISRDDGTSVTASIELKDLGGRRVYAYLRYSIGGRTVNIYVGEAAGTTRAGRLRHAWRRAHTRGLTAL
jgi:DNA mismatch endonuclease (patch repair protein)